MRKYNIEFTSIDTEKSQIAHQFLRLLSQLSPGRPEKAAVCLSEDVAELIAYENLDTVVPLSLPAATPVTISYERDKQTTTSHAEKTQNNY